jgi:adenosylcobyric acid synthase
MKPGLMAPVLDSFARLAAEADLILVEGAGSAAEVNLRSGDIANMGFARAAGVPVVLVGDIDRGGVIASLVGTKAVTLPEDAALIGGFIVNKLRGDPALFADGMAFIAERTGWAPLGLVPFFPAASRLPAEDALALHARPRAAPAGKGCLIVVLAYPHIANFDDVDPLSLEPGVEVAFLREGEAIPGEAALVILPGSKATIADLAAVRRAGWDVDLAAHARRGGRILGICGGFQMLGTRIADPEGIEGPPSEVQGLGLLHAETRLTGDKVLVETAGESIAGAVPFRGYEMHVGRTRGPALSRPVLRLKDGRTDGAADPSGRIAGVYVHGLFADDRQRAHWLALLGADPSGLAYEGEVEAVLDALAAHLAAHIDCGRLLELARVPTLSRMSPGSRP